MSYILKDMQAFNVKVLKNKILKITFVYDSISILYENKHYSFINIKGKTICFDLNTNSCTNLNDVLVFIRGAKTLSLKVSEFLSIDGVLDKIQSLIPKKYKNDFLTNSNSFSDLNSLNEKLKILYLEIDYELLCLFDALTIKNDIEINKSKKRLMEINKEIEFINKKLSIS